MAGIMQTIGEKLHIGGNKDEHKPEEHKGEHLKVDEHHKVDEHKDQGIVGKIKGKILGEGHEGEKQDGEKNKKKKKEKKKHDDGHESSSSSDSD